MTIEERARVSENLFNEAIETLGSKGKAYAESFDVLSNFKTVGNQIGGSKYQAWLVYTLKHMESIRLAIKNAGKDGIPHDDSEGIHSRIVDMVCYMAILESLLFEDMEDSVNPIKF